MIPSLSKTMHKTTLKIQRGFDTISFSPVGCADALDHSCVAVRGSVRPETDVIWWYCIGGLLSPLQNNLHKSLRTFAKVVAPSLVASGNSRTVTPWQRILKINEQKAWLTRSPLGQQFIEVLALVSHWWNAATRWPVIIRGSGGNACSSVG